MKQLLQFCESEREWLRQRLARLVRLESPTDDKAAVDRCGAELASWLSEMGGAVREVASATAGNHLVARFEWGGRDDRPLMLLGHFDTVWPVGQLSAMPLAERDGRLFGPGTFDMKGGIAIGMLAIRALQAHAVAVGRGDPLPPVVFLLTADEETGGATSRSLIEEQARQSRGVLVLEPSLPGGALKTSRKGCGQFTVHVTGRASHAGVEPEKGASAILELCEQLLILDTVQDARAGTTITTGVVGGGTRPNVVPADARAWIDVRVSSADEAGRVSRAMHDLSPRRAGTHLRVEGGFDRPPFERTAEVARLFELAKAVGAALGQEVAEGSTGGASDGNITASLGVPTLDGLGAVGDGAHALHEHVVLGALPGRAALVAGLIAEMSRG
jgi:glutamate carboxypeptidase